MELLPYKDENNDIIYPKIYCDFKCERIHKLYRKFFIRQETYPFSINTIKIDLSL